MDKKTLEVLQGIEDREARELWKTIPEGKREAILEVMREMEVSNRIAPELVTYIRGRLLDS